MLKQRSKKLNELGTAVSVEQHLEALVQRYMVRQSKEMQASLNRRMVEIQHSWERKLAMMVAQNIMHDTTQQIMPGLIAGRGLELSTNQLLEIIASSVSGALEKIL